MGSPRLPRGEPRDDPRSQAARLRQADGFRGSVRPVAELVLAAVREPLEVGAVVVDRVELDRARHVRGEDEMASVGRPARRLVPGVGFGQLADLVGPQVQDVDVEDVFDPGDVGDPVARRGPGGRIVVIAPETHLADVRTLGVHDVDLGGALAGPVAGEGDLAARRRPGGRRFDGRVEGQPLGFHGFQVEDVDLGVALLAHARAEGHLLSVGGEGRRIIGPLGRDQRFAAVVNVADVQAGAAFPVRGEGDGPLVRRPGRDVILDLVEGDPGLVGAVVVHHVDLVVAVAVADEAEARREDRLFAVELHQLVGQLVGAQADAGLVGLVALADDEPLALDVE